MQSRDYDALIVPSNDPHFSEYVAAHWKSREWISGFSGSAGTAVITAQQAIVSVDSRYFLQAEKQLAPGFALLKQRIPHTPAHLDWLIGELPPDATVAVDGRLCSVSSVVDIGARLAPHDIELQLCEDPFTPMWSERPPLPNSELFALDIAYSGVARKDKLQSLRTDLAGPRWGPIMRELDARNPSSTPPMTEIPMAAAANMTVCHAAWTAFKTRGDVPVGTSDS